MSTLSITVDIEDWYHIPSVTGSSFSVYKDTEEFFNKWKDRYDYLTKPTERLLKIFNDHDIRATFFIVADVIDNYPGLVENIKDKGHEIASHGLHHACNIDMHTKKPAFSEEEFIARTKKAKKKLEIISGKSVIGYRAPNALLGRWMIGSLKEMGFKYDSSIGANSLVNKSDMNLSEVPSAPFFPTKELTPGGPKNFIEFPFSHYNIMGFKFPTAGGPYLRFFGRRPIQAGLKQSLKRGHTILYFHSIDISRETFPKIGKNRPGYWLIKGKTVENRLIKIFNKFKNVEKLPLNDYAERMITE